MTHHGITRRRLVEALGCARTLDAAAQAVGYAQQKSLRVRLRRERLARRVHQTNGQRIIVVEDRGNA